MLIGEGYDWRDGVENAWDTLVTLNPEDVCRRTKAHLDGANGNYALPFFNEEIYLIAEKRQILGSSGVAELALEELPWQHQRDTGPRHYDLRALIDSLWLIDWHAGHCTIGMNLRCDNSGSGRPEQVSIALGFQHHPQSVHRTKLILKTS